VLDPGLNGRVALVTGANQGIGAATVRALAAHGVAVLLTYPPVTDTGWITPAVREQAVAGSALRHLAQPDEVAEVIVLLASHQARHIAGQVVRMS
jgi:3-oxoacyl-[acyl-carrier protein] reductase